MITIRTALVLAAFVAMGLTTVAEHLVRAAPAQPDPFVTVDAGEAMPGKALRLTKRLPAAPVEPDLSPWI